MQLIARAALGPCSPSVGVIVSATKPEKPTTTLAACIAVAGSVPAGVVLYRLMFWWPKANRTIKGRKYFAKPYTELMNETWFTRRQLETYLSQLRQKKLIQTAQGLFYGKNVLHVLITNECETALKNVLSDPQNGGTQVHKNGGTQVHEIGGTQVHSVGGTQVHKNGGTHKHGVQQGDIQGEPHGLSVLTNATEGDPYFSGEGMLGGEIPVNKEKRAAKSVKDVIAEASGKGKLAKKIHKPDSIKGMALTWVKLVSEETGDYVPPLSAKQCGQLKLFKGNCPEGQAEAILRHVIRHWTEFIKKVEAEFGVKALPAKPNIDFLLKYVGPAVNLFLAQQKPQAEQEAESEGKSFAKPVQLIANPKTEDQKPQSFEELMAIIGKDIYE